jgi:hypothetical protein
MSKERLTVTVDAQWIRAGSEAVKEGRADSISAWVNRALSERALKERRLRSMGEAIAAYEAEFGVITPDELLMQERRDRTDGRAIRGERAVAGRRRPRRQKE